MTGPGRRPDADHDAVCASTARHRLVVAPPGTGKTHLAIRLAGSLVGSSLPGPPPVSPPVSLAGPTATRGAQVLVLTFSNLARTQLECEAVRQLTTSDRRRIVIENYHGLFWRAVCAHRRALGLPMQLELVSRSVRIAALRALDPTAVKTLDRQAGLLDAFAEQAYTVFRDGRSPSPETTARLLSGVLAEQHAGRLVFDDLGPLFWQLLEQFPVIAEAYQDRFPIVVADEHQDASALQDAVVRRLGVQTLVVLADPMQLIHGFRGARAERLDQHAGDCDARFALRTPHRWHNNAQAGAWLLQVRHCLQGQPTPDRAPRPPTLTIVTTRADRGLNAMLAPIRQAVGAAFAAGAARIAVLAHTNDDVIKIRSHLTRHSFAPQQPAGALDFDTARADIEALSTLADPQSLARHLMHRLSGLVPTLETTTVSQITARLRPDTVHAAGCSARVGALLAALEILYRDGPGSYVQVLVAALDACATAGHHLPQPQAVRILREAAASTEPGQDVTAIARIYAQRAIAAANRAPREQDGLMVMTVHQSKGKEFDAVVLVGANERSFPDTPDGRHLFYVALTRGSARWTIIAPDPGATPLLRQL